MPFDVDEIKRTTDIVRVIGSYLPLKKRGAEFLGLCPFHDDHNPSFMVNPVKGIAHCFSCDAHHDVLSFVMEMDNCDFPFACEKLGGSTEWKPMISANKAEPLPDRITSKPPENAPTPSMELPSLGKPVKTYALLDVDGSLNCYEARYDDPNDKCRMFTWGARPGQIPRWGCGHPNIPRPLYGLHRIRMFENESQQILVTEGAKKADAAHNLLGKLFVCLSWTGGSNAMSRHDWSLIRNRKVILWPDADLQAAKTESESKKYGVKRGEIIPYHFQPGQRAMFELGAILTKQGCTVRVINVAGMDPSWDIADAEEEGWDTATTLEWARSRASDYVLEETETNNHADETIPLPDDIPVEIHETSSKQDPLPPGAASVETKKLTSVCLSDVKMRNIRWLWLNKIARGKITLLAGDPGLGKSQITASMCAIVTTGGKWPGDHSECEKGSVVILSIEDDPQDTIKPRLLAAGADVSKVHQVTTTLVMNKKGGYDAQAFSLQEDMRALGKKIKELGDVRLVIVDPISAYMANVDTHNLQESRHAMNPIKELCEQLMFACVLVSHLTKNSKAPFNSRVQGSVSFVAVARSVFGVIKDPDDPDRRYFLPSKNNVAVDRNGLAYKIESYEIEQPDPDTEEDRHIHTSRVMWEYGIVDRLIDDPYDTGSTAEEGSTVSTAVEFIEQCLENGEVYGKGLIEHGKREENFSEPTLRRAARKLNVQMRKVGGGVKGKTMWSLPKEWFTKRNRRLSYDPSDTQD